MSLPKSRSEPSVVGIAAQLVDQEPGVEDVDAHATPARCRDCRGWRAGRRASRRNRRCGQRRRPPSRRSRSPPSAAPPGSATVTSALAVDVLLQHQLIIHLVDVIARQDDHIFGSVALDDVDILEHRVGGAFIPLELGHALRGGQDVEALVAFGPQEVPAALQVADQRMRLVLGRDADAADARIDRVGQREVDDPRLAAEIDRGLGAACRSARCRRLPRPPAST